MRASDKNLTVLSAAERAALYGLPDFDDFQRAEFLALTDEERTLAQGRHGLSEQILCMLQIGYFKAKKSFFWHFVVRGAARGYRLPPSELFSQ